MKPILLTCICLIFCGCATSIPREKLRDIFILVKDSKFDAAESKFEATTADSLIGQYSTYSDQTIPAVNSPNHDDVSTLINSAKNYIEGCKDKVEKAKKLSPLDTAYENIDFNESFRKLQEDFSSDCQLKIQEKWSSISAIKKYSTVDLFPIFRSLESDFKKEVIRINSEMSHIENQHSKKVADEKARMDAYENSQEYYSKKLCEIDDRIKLAKSIIDRENEVGKISGIINKNKLYEAGKAIQINQDRVKHFSKEYKAKFGKAWTVSECK